VDARVADVTEPAPNQQEARASLAEASSKAASVRRADSEFRWLLIVIAAVYVVGSIVASAFPRRGGIGGIALILVVTGGIAAMILLGRRIRAYSSSGIAWFVVSVFAFIFWNSVVNGVSMLSGWWSPHQPGYHFAVSEAIGVIPLVVAAWLLGRR
jgi:hypothetical protein